MEKCKHSIWLIFVKQYVMASTKWAEDLITWVGIEILNVYTYRIGLVEKQIEDWKFEENNLEEQKTRLEVRVGLQDYIIFKFGVV